MALELGSLVTQALMALQYEVGNKPWVHVLGSG